MGTSTSRRSPSGDIRWRAARAALMHASPGRAAEQLLAAASADAWPAMLRSESLRAIAEFVDDALRQVPQLAATTTGHEAVRALVEAARDKALAAGDGGLLVALGERSLSRLLQLQLRGDSEPFVYGPSAAFFTETVRQLLMHLAARDLPGASPTLGAREARERTREISDAGAALLTRSQAVLQADGSPAWGLAVDQLFGSPSGVSDA